MNDPQTEFARQWLKKAENDVITARQTLALKDGPTDTPSALKVAENITSLVKNKVDRLFANECGGSCNQ